MEAAAKTESSVAAPAPRRMAPATPVQPDPHLVANPMQMRNPLAGLDVREMTTATLGVVEGTPGSWGQVLFGTLLRAGLIGGALYFYPKSGRKLGTIAGQSLAASSAITLFLLAAHAIKAAVAASGSAKSATSTVLK